MIWMWPGVNLDRDYYSACPGARADSQGPPTGEYYCYLRYRLADPWRWLAVLTRHGSERPTDAISAIDQCVNSKWWKTRWLLVFDKVFLTLSLLYHLGGKVCFLYLKTLLNRYCVRNYSGLNHRLTSRELQTGNRVPVPNLNRILVWLVTTSA